MATVPGWDHSPCMDWTPNVFRRGRGAEAGRGQAGTAEAQAIKQGRRGVSPGGAEWVNKVEVVNMNESLNPIYSVRRHTSSIKPTPAEKNGGAR